MHYATRLKRENEKLEAVVEEFQKRLTFFKKHLELPKFKGEGNDYIQTADVHNFLSYIDEAHLAALE